MFRLIAWIFGFQALLRGMTEDARRADRIAAGLLVGAPHVARHMGYVQVQAQGRPRPR